METIDGTRPVNLYLERRCVSCATEVRLTSKLKQLDFLPADNLERGQCDPKAVSGHAGLKQDTAKSI
jgi:hypothetical protein